MNARYYRPNTNRWLSPDTIVPNPANPQSLNRYSYSYNNPVNYIDPDGHDPVWCNDPYDSGYDAVACGLNSDWNLGLEPTFSNQNDYNHQIFALTTTAIDSLISSSWTTISQSDSLFLSRIVKRMIARESQFDPFANNLSGAKGLMQITQIGLNELSGANAQFYNGIFGDLGSINRYSPYQNIRAGIALLLGGYSQIASVNSEWFTAMSPEQRWTAAVAAFNTGVGNVNAAISNCVSGMGVDACTWDNILVELCAFSSDCHETEAYVIDVMEPWYENPADQPVLNPQ